MTGLDARPLRARIADRLPWLAGLTVLIVVVQAVDLWVRLASRFAECRTPSADRATSEAIAPRVLTRTTTSADPVVWIAPYQGYAG